MAFNGYSFFSGMLTKTNELWGIGYAEHGLGGGLSTPISDLLNLTLPVKIADSVKSTTLHSTAGRYSYIGHILTNEGEVFEIGKKSSNKGGHAIGASGQYYLLSEQSTPPIGLRFSQVTAILSLSDFQENGHFDKSKRQTNCHHRYWRVPGQF